MIGRRVEVAGQQAEAPGEAGPYGAVAAADRVDVPALAAAGVPYGVAQAALDLAVELVLHLALDLQALQLALVEQVEGAEHVVDLRFDHVDHRVVAQAGVRAHEEEQVGEAGGEGALVGFRAFRPGVEQVDATAAEDHAARQRVAGGEAGAEDDGVNRAFLAILGDDAVGADFLDAVGDDVDVGLGQRRVVVVGDQHALAAHGVVGRDLGAQHRVLDLALDVTLGHQLGELHHLRGQGEADDAAFEDGVDAAAPELLQQGEALEARAFVFADGAVRLGHDPGRGALVEVELADHLLDLRDELDGRGTGADHGDALARQVVVVVPLLGMEALAGEVLQAIEVGDGRGGQGAHAGHHELRGVVITGGVVYVPELFAVAPGHAGDFGAEQGLVLQAVFLPAAFQVALDLFLLGEHPRPVGVRLEGEGVEVRLHVAAAARVVVDAPGAADAGFLLEQEEIVLAFLFQADRHAQAGEAGADDGNLAVAGRGGR